MLYVFMSQFTPFYLVFPLTNYYNHSYSYYFCLLTFIQALEVINPLLLLYICLHMGLLKTLQWAFPEWLFSEWLKKQLVKFFKIKLKKWYNHNGNKIIFNSTQWLECLQIIHSKYANLIIILEKKLLFKWVKHSN